MDLLAQEDWEVQLIWTDVGAECVLWCSRQKGRRPGCLESGLIGLAVGGSLSVGLRQPKLSPGESYQQVNHSCFCNRACQVAGIAGFRGNHLRARQSCCHNCLAVVWYSDDNVYHEGLLVRQDELNWSTLCIFSSCINKSIHSIHWIRFIVLPDSDMYVKDLSGTTMGHWPSSSRTQSSSISPD